MILPVIFIFVVLGILQFFEKQNEYSTKLIVFVYIILVIIAAFRPEDMPDYSNYQYVFQTGDDDRMEYGFMWIVYLMRNIAHEPLILFTLFAALSISIKLKAVLQLSSYVLLSIVIYVSNIYILHDMIQMRCAIASGLLLFGVKYIYERNIRRFLLVGGIAMLFHYSSVVMFPLWFINTKITQKYLYMLLIPMAYIVAISGNLLGSYVQYIPIQAVQDLWQSYNYVMLYGIGDEINIFNYVHLARCLICMFILYNIGIILKYNELVIVLVKIYTISLVVFVLCSDIPVIAFRISELLQVVEVILLPMIVFVFKNHIVGKAVVLVIGLVFLLINIYVQNILL